MSDAEGEEVAPKCGRGRPKGSLNKKTLERLAATEAVAAPEAAETAAAPEVVPEPVEEEPGPVEAPSDPLPAPPSAARAAKPKRQASAARGGSAANQRADAPPKRAVRTAPPPAPRPPDRVPGPLLNEASLLDIMKAGLAHARTKHKADKVARYDAMFAY